MQTLLIPVVKNCLSLFSTITGLTVALTCLMLSLLLNQPEHARYQCNCNDYPKTKRLVKGQLYPGPFLLHSVLPASLRSGAEPTIE
ncbi:MAG: hypothetical protein INR73_15940 [Williamsia sp.]|nr:hypothetical protein [Williamsia sp.]